MFPNRALADQYFPVNFDEEFYYERTKRNMFWVGEKQGQKKIHDLRIGIAGLGGMGSNLAEIMVRLGVGHIKIADPDIIEASNLNRQVIANRQTIGKKKATASVNELRSISEDFELVVYEDGITKSNAEEFVDGLDVVIDEIDVFPLQAHLWLHQAANKLGLPLYSGFIIGLGTHIYKFQGQDYTFEDFMLRDEKKIENPTLNFLFDRFVEPRPSCFLNEDIKDQFLVEARENSIPIFGTSTYLSQSMLAIRVIADYLNLTDRLGGKPTPVMPEFLKIDPLDLSIEICSVCPAETL